MHKNVKCECGTSLITRWYCITIISPNILHAKWQKNLHPSSCFITCSHINSSHRSIEIVLECNFPEYQEPFNVKHKSISQMEMYPKLTRQFFFAWLLTFLISHHFWRLMLTVASKVSLTALYHTGSYLNSVIYYNRENIRLN